MTRDEKWLLEEKYDGTATAEYETDKGRLALGEPLAYIIGWQPFLGLTIYLDSKPLIPRPETEWWTEELLGAMSKWSGRPQGGDPRTFAKSDQQFRFLDLCAGSGAIGCAALARLPNARVSFGEIDPAHEATIRKNIRENRLDESRASIGIGDLFEPFDAMKFDFIAANPPYVPFGRALPASVARHEPTLALIAGEDGLEVIRRIADALPKHLAKGGVAWVECDRGHSEASRQLFEEHGFVAKIQNDQYDKPRVIVVQHNK